MSELNSLRKAIIRHLADRKCIADLEDKGFKLREAVEMAKNAIENFMGEWQAVDEVYQPDEDHVMFKQVLDELECLRESAGGFGYQPEPALNWETKNAKQQEGLPEIAIDVEGLVDELIKAVEERSFVYEGDKVEERLRVAEIRVRSARDALKKTILRIMLDRMLLSDERDALRAELHATYTEQPKASPSNPEWDPQPVYPPDRTGNWIMVAVILVLAVLSGLLVAGVL